LCTHTQQFSTVVERSPQRTRCKELELFTSDTQGTAPHSQTSPSVPATLHDQTQERHGTCPQCAQTNRPKNRPSKGSMPDRAADGIHSRHSHGVTGTLLVVAVLHAQFKRVVHAGHASGEAVQTPWRSHSGAASARHVRHSSERVHSEVGLHVHSEVGLGGSAIGRAHGPCTRPPPSPLLASFIIQSSLV